MSNVAEFQKKGIITFNPAFEGDLANPQVLPGQIQSAVISDSAGITVGTFCWQVVNSDTPIQITQAKGSTVRPLGFVLRSNENINAQLGITDGYSMNIQQYQTVAIAKFGSVFAKITTVIGSNAVAQFANVYVNNTTGTLAIDAGGSLTGYTKLNWLYASPASQLVTNSVVKIITNDQNTQIVS